MMNSYQQITMLFRKDNREVLITSVYARCNQLDRLELWEEMEALDTTSTPWVVGGDFNVILNEEEKLGGLDFTHLEAADFAHCINECALIEVKFVGSKYTWWNGRIGEACIFKRLDRILVNNAFSDIFPNLELEHLIREGSDHAPLHLVCKSDPNHIIKPFRFLNFWIKHKGFMEVVKKNWVINFAGCPFIEMHAKMRNLKSALVEWSKNEFGNIFMKIATLEDIIKVKEAQLEVLPNAVNRAELSRLEAELRKFLKVEEDFWRQKAGMTWFSQGDRNTKKIHSSVKGRRKKLKLDEITTEQGINITDQHQIGETAVDFYREQFEETNDHADYAMLNVIPKLLSEEENDWLVRLPENDEVKKAVDELNRSSAAGPDGFSGLFFQKCWSIIGDDVTRTVKAFFCGSELPNFVTHTNLVLLHKKEVVRSFSDLRPISLSNFVNKIITRVLHGRIVLVLPKLISSNQSGFVKRKSVTENVLLAQEIIKDINLRNKNINVVVKLDMAKAYDRVSWIYLTKVFRCFGFSEVVIDVIWRILSNN